MPRGIWCFKKNQHQEQKAPTTDVLTMIRKAEDIRHLATGLGPCPNVKLFTFCTGSVAFAGGKESACLVLNFCL